LENDEQVNAMMAGVSPDDQRVLRLAILHGLDGEALAEALGCNPGAARVRLHRALNRLRTSYLARKEVGDE
jgi:DNA-directed RNA polymerase specialized sigma24 family protein